MKKDKLIKMLGKTPAELKMAALFKTAKRAVANGLAHWFVGKPFGKSHGVYLGYGGNTNNSTFIKLDPNDIE